VLDEEEDTKFALRRKKEKSGKAHVTKIMLQLANEPCNVEHVSSMEAFKVDFEESLAHGIELVFN
jgi:hypothetical protein